MPFGTWRLFSRFRELDYKKTVLSALCLITLAQTGCGLVSFGSGDEGKSTANTPKTAQQKDAKSTQSNGVGSLDPRDLASPPAPGEGITVDPPAPLLGAAATTGPPDALSSAGRFEPRPGGMLGSLGMNLETYFAEDIQDPVERTKRLERALTAIQGDLKSVAPSIQRLVAVEEDIQELVTQLEVLLENETAQPAAPAPAPYSPYAAAASQEPAPLTAAPAVSPPPAPAQPPPAKAADPPAQAPPAAPDIGSGYTPPAYLMEGNKSASAVAPAPAAPSGGANVTSLRVGEHADKVRLVLDVSGDTPYKVDIDNNEKILIIELPDAGWSTAREMTYGKTPILQSYRVDSGKDGKGSMLIMPLKQPSTILYQSKLNALSGTGKRIVVDLAR